MTEPEANAQQPPPTGPTTVERTHLGATFTPHEPPRTPTADASWPADSPVPYTLTAKAETLLGTTAPESSSCGTGMLCGIRSTSPQPGPGPSGQPVTYVTKISVPPSDSGIQRLHARMKEPGPEPEAGL